MAYPIVLMDSFSRSGETLLLRCLNAHSRLRAVHDLAAQNTKAENDMFAAIRQEGLTEIDGESPLLEGVEPPPEGGMFVLKNATWHAPQTFTKHFTLIRNPFSVAMSCRAVEDPQSDALHRIYLRWTREIAPELRQHFQRRDNLDIILALWSIKVSAALQAKRPIVFYEELVEHPEATLRALLTYLGLEWEDRVLHSHLDYEVGVQGHGQIPLDAPIHAGSAHSYLGLPGGTFDRIFAATYATFHACGYRFNDGVLGFSDDSPGARISTLAREEPRRAKSTNVIWSRLSARKTG